MAKLGSKRNPLILRIADERKVDEITATCQENGWHFILGYEPDEKEDLSDLERKLSPITVVREMKMGRNDPCWCDSGKKYKKCCGSST